MTYKLANWNETFDSLSKDISAGGVGLILNERLANGAPLEIEIHSSGPDSDTPITIKGIVVWSHQVDKNGAVVEEGSEALFLKSSSWRSGLEFYGKDLDSNKQYFRIGIKLDKEIHPDLMKILRRRA